MLSREDWEANPVSGRMEDQTSRNLHGIGDDDTVQVTGMPGHALDCGAGSRKWYTQAKYAPSPVVRGHPYCPRATPSPPP